MLKLLILIAVFGIIESIGQEKNVTINHRGRFFMRNLNEARAILASGALRQLKILELGMIKLPPVGPAANMFRLKWSTELEDVAKKSIRLLPASNFYGNYKDGGYSGFYWKYDLVQAVKKLVEKKGVPGLSFGNIEDTLKKFSSALETLVFIVWAILTYPTQFPIGKKQDIGPSEALFAHRYEIGCHFDDFALCMMRAGVNNGSLYEEGVACTQCPTNCEFSENIDGSIEEGDLCIPPAAGSDFEAQMKESEEMQEFIDSSSLNFSPMLICALLVIVFILRK
ncbi:hypothetical protein CRE_28798 [Caenorhabditis remanei]|uniref:SCP domain-containing protein n=1 Tax=Caenorhabditis remanei TaxID=31234 RepID=E3MK46_CAERE|nr:hypothetical protein CRE_28798 [Caenorhabditis remanei]